MGLLKHSTSCISSPTPAAPSSARSTRNIPQAFADTEAVAHRTDRRCRAGDGRGRSSPATRGRDDRRRCANATATSTSCVLRRYDEIAEIVPARQAGADQAKLVIGAYFSEEYSFEAAALFNPSIVLHPDQRGRARRRRPLPAVAARDRRGAYLLGHLPHRHVERRATASRSTRRATQAVSPRIDDADVAGDGVTRIMCDGSRDPSESVLFPVTAQPAPGDRGSAPVPLRR